MGEGGNIAELSTIIVVVTFLGALVLTFSFIPLEFAMAGEDVRTVNVPDFFEGIDIYSFASILNFTMSNTSTMEEFTLGGHKLWFYTDANGYFGLEHVHTQIWIFFFTHSQTIYSNGIEVSSNHYYSFADEWVESLDVDDLEDLEGNQEGTVKLVFRCDHTQEFVWIGYNVTEHPTYHAAYDAGELWIFFGMRFDDVNTIYNAWDLIGMLLFFQLPEMHVVINALIAIPIWVAIAYLTYVLILKMIPFI